MADPAKTCAITGANGYIGSRITAHLRREGWTVYELRHHLVSAVVKDGLLLPYSLEEGVKPEILHGVRVLIHCAYDFRPVRWEEIRAINVNGSLRLFAAAREAGVNRIIFLSSMSAFAGCKSLYGRGKMEVEKEALKTGAAVIRPGLVFGKSAGGTFGALHKLVSASKVIPVIGSGQHIQYLAHEEDLCRLIAKTCVTDSDYISSPISAAAGRSVTIRGIVHVVAEAKGQKKTVIPIPWQAVLLGLKATEILGPRIGLRSDSVISLVNPNPNPDFAPLRRMGVPFREFNAHTLIA
ncbi:MAG: NAD-dependent epimerase/dehydratase family protein [Anaerolineae bacterium]|nr:NAD-dependent epimerase/dehydratase family protein [Anaerolineae bacterium]